MNPFRRFTILKRLHRHEQFESPDDHAEFQEKLGRLVQRGVIEVVPVNGKHRSSLDEEAWFRDRRTGAVYRYIPPDWPSAGHWGPVANPEVKSFLEGLCGDLYPTREQYDLLVTALDQAWERGQILCALHPEKGELEDAFWHDPRTDETFHLILVNPYQKGGSWMRVFHSEKDGTWPGVLQLSPPPWRDASKRREPRQGS